MERDNYSDNLPDDFEKVNEGVPGQIGGGQIDPAQNEQDAHQEEAEKVKAPAKKKGGK